MLGCPAKSHCNNCNDCNGCNVAIVIAESLAFSGALQRSATTATRAIVALRCNRLIGWSASASGALGLCVCDGRQVGLESSLPEAKRELLWEAPSESARFRSPLVPRVHATHPEPFPQCSPRGLESLGRSGDVAVEAMHGETREHSGGLCRAIPRGRQRRAIGKEAKTDQAPENPTLAVEPGGVW